MKRLIIAVALIALLSGSAFAEGVTFGVKGALNLADLTGDDIDDTADTEDVASL